MKTIILLMIVFAASSFGFAQERDFSIEIELEDISIDRNAVEEFVTVTIKNNADLDLKAEGLGQIEFEFAKCGPYAGDSLTCRGPLSRFSAIANIPRAKVRRNEKFQFRVNLAKIKWRNSWTVPSEQSFLQISDENIHFFATIKRLTGYKDVVVVDSRDGSKRPGKEPVYLKTYSNVIDVVFSG